MMLFVWLKMAHVGSALLSISGFALRCYWRRSDNPLLQRRLTKRHGFIRRIFVARVIDCDRVAAGGQLLCDSASEPATGPGNQDYWCRHWVSFRFD